ncbi:MAG: sensor histidine kinase [Proteobacteria bacterium]|nr:sensor histidine kinase [Pseudomonadota bacterium]
MPAAQSLFIEVVMAFSLGYRQTLDELEHSNRELASVSQFKSRMLSMVAHDLTNHMTAIKIFANSIAQRSEGSVQSHAQNILEVIADEEMLVQNLLDIGRIDTGRLKLVLVPLPLLALIERAVARISRTTTRHSFSVVGSDVRVRADQAKVQQILENVIGNAVKYSPEGGGVDVVVTVEGGHAVVEVRDRGLGISPEDLPHVFEPFYRGSRTEGTSIRGTGLGLSIVRSLVKLHGGSISADSVPGKGTTVRFALPLSIEASERAAPHDEDGQQHEQ